MTDFECADGTLSSYEMSMRFDSGFGYRDSTLLSLWDFAHVLPYNIFELMQTTVIKCVRTEQQKSCSIPFTEYVYQEPGYPNRNTLTHRIADAEERLGEVLGYPVGPTCISNERHTLNRWGQTIQLNMNKVITTGRCTYERIDIPNVSQTRELLDFKQDIAQPGAANPYYEVVRFRLENIQPFQQYFDAPGYSSGRHTSQWSNLMIFERGLGPRTCDDDSTLGHRIRPFNVKCDLDCGQVVIDIPSVMAVKWSEYGHFRTDTGKVTKIDLCDPDNLINGIEVWQRQICKPDGTAFLRPNPCRDCCGSGCCNVCSVKEVPICLEPVSSEQGRFRVYPIINTAKVFDEDRGIWCPDECNPCWERADWNQCCDWYSAPTSCLQNPMEVCVSYVAGCNPCECYVNDPCDDHVIPDEPCERFKFAIAALAIAMAPKACECGCLGELYKTFQQDLRSVSATQRFIFRMNEEEFLLGTTQGAVWAYEAIKNLRDTRVQIALI